MNATNSIKKMKALSVVVIVFIRALLSSFSLCLSVIIQKGFVHECHEFYKKDEKALSAVVIVFIRALSSAFFRVFYVIIYRDRSEIIP
jgi:hypothetical protein